MRELDAKVAEKVFGLSVFATHALLADGTEFSEYYLIADHKPPANYTTDMAADYAVLEYVRQNWPYADQLKVDVFLGQLWHSRNPNPLLSYEPGDYSKAALKALGESID